MECNFFVGQKVVCVDAASLSGGIWYGDVPLVGAVYTITNMAPSPLALYWPERHIPVALFFAEIKNTPPHLSGRDGGYNPARFRPIHDTSHQVNAIKELLAPIFKGETVKVST